MYQKGPPDDVMKLRYSKDLRTLRLCNPPVFQLRPKTMWPAIDCSSLSRFRFVIWWVSRSNRHDPCYSAILQRRYAIL